MTRLDVAPKLDLDGTLATKVLAILAQRGAGKTHTAKVVAEELIALGQPWVVLDPLGGWWGLRSSADGKKAGLPVIILGGDHGDVPLDPDAGAYVASLVVDSPGWYVIDLSGFDSKSEDRRFATAFATRLYRAKAQAKTPLHLFIDEADLFIPQQSPAGDKTMLGAFEQLVRRGRSRGLGVTLISQRAAVLNKNVLEMLDVLIALRTTGMRDRATMKAYMAVSGTAAQMVEMDETLPGLRLGEAWVWEPGRLPPTFGRFQVRRLRTFDSSSTPEAGATQVDPAAFAAVDLDVVKERMAESIAKARDEDPVLLRRRVKELERQAGAPVEVPVEVEVIPEGLREALEDTKALYERTVEGFVAAAGSVQIAIAGLQGVIDRLPTRNSARSRAAASGIPDTPRPRTGGLTSRDTDSVPPKASGIPDAPARDSARPRAIDPGRRSMRREMLRVLAAFPEGRTRRQLALQTGYSAKGGAFGNALSALRTDGLIVGKDPVIPTEDGVEQGRLMGGEPLSDRDRLDHWYRELGQGMPRYMLEALVTAYPAWLDREELAAAAGMLARGEPYEASGGSFGNALSRLRTLDLIIESGTSARAAEELIG